MVCVVLALIANFHLGLGWFAMGGSEAPTPCIYIWFLLVILSSLCSACRELSNALCFMSNGQAVGEL